MLNLDPQQVKQAETQRIAADGAVTARITEVYHWLLAPTQKTPQSPVEWQAFRLPSGHDALAVRAGKKLKNDESLIASYAGSSLKMELDRVPLWRDGRHVSIKQLAEDFARYVYLPRLKDPKVLLGAVRDGAGLLTWEEDSFAFADHFDQAADRYRGLRGGQHFSLVNAESPNLLVKGAIARAQLDAEVMKPDPVARPGPQATAGDGSTSTVTGPGPGPNPNSGTIRPGPTPPGTPGPRRFHGTVRLDATRLGRDAGRVAEEVIAHLTGIVGARVTVTLEVEAEIPGGASDHIVRTVTENSRTLKFTSQGFEAE